MNLDHWHDRETMTLKVEMLWRMAHECREAMTDEAQRANIDGQMIFKRLPQLQADMAECYDLAHTFALGAWR